MGGDGAAGVLGGDLDQLDPGIAVGLGQQQQQQPDHPVAEMRQVPVAAVGALPDQPLLAGEAQRVVEGLALGVVLGTHCSIPCSRSQSSAQLRKTTTSTPCQAARSCQATCFGPSLLFLCIVFSSIRWYSCWRKSVRSG